MPNNPYAVEYLTQILLAEEAEWMKACRSAANWQSRILSRTDFQRAYANLLYRARQYGEAIDVCERIMDLDPNHLITYGTLANALVQTGRYPEAEIAFKKGRTLLIREPKLGYMPWNITLRPPGKY